MITLRKAEDRGFANHGWLQAKHTFSFADYHDQAHMGFRSLRVINDDTVAGGAGFDTHPHRDMEIITYVLSGALAHKDSMGNGRVIRPGEIQYMAAGSGVEHSEFNHSPIEPVHLLQIWIRPDQKGTPPRYQEKSMRDAATGQLHLVASKSGRDGSIALQQDADVLLTRLEAQQSVRHVIAPKRALWVHVAEGEVSLNGRAVKGGDGAAVEDETELTISANGSGSAQVLVFDLA